MYKQRKYHNTFFSFTYPYNNENNKGHPKKTNKHKYTSSSTTWEIISCVRKYIEVQHM